MPPDLDAIVERHLPGEAPPRWWWPTDRAILGVIELKDVVKQGIREKFDEMRQMGIRTVMITGDNPLTAAAIAQEAGVDDYLAEATPEAKMDLIRSEQEGGKLVAMTGDGTNDAPALAQADVGVAMNTGTTAAKEAGNMVDLDSNPTKLIDVVEIGKQLLITRGSLTTFSIANDVAKYFAIIPALFVGHLPAAADTLNILKLHSPQSAVLSAVIFNALVIVALIPLALRGVRFRAASSAGHPAPQRVHLRGGRDHRPLHLHQTHRPHPRRPPRLLIASAQHARPPPPFGHLDRGRSRPSSGSSTPSPAPGVAQLLFRHQANGSITANGSTLIGQNWAATKCPGHPTGSCVFHGRPDDIGPYAGRPQASCRRGQPTGRQRQQRRVRRHQPGPEVQDPARRTPRQLVAYWHKRGRRTPPPTS